MIIIQATIRSGGRPPLRVLRFTGDVIAFSNPSAAAIRAGLLEIFKEAVKCARRGRESVPAIFVREAMRISQGLASISFRQPNEIEMLMSTRFYQRIDDGRAQSNFNRVYPRGRERNPPAERSGRGLCQSVPARERTSSGGRGDSRYSAPPAPRTDREQASGSGLPRPVTPPKAPPRDPGTYLSEQDFADIRERRYGRFDGPGPAREGTATPAPPIPRATATRSRSPKQRPFGEQAFPGKVASTRVRAETPPQSSTASSHEAPPQATARMATPPPMKAPPLGTRPPPSPKAAPTITEGRGPKAGTVNRPAALVPPPEKAGQPPLVLGGTRADGTFVTIRGEPLPKRRQALRFQRRCPPMPTAAPTMWMRQGRLPR